eukprot:Nitzschia sp. Nitz4//scaffold6_size259037//220090//222675//NITZ4_001118-RA/size259037-processed-gene-0.94-mRNA-1//-1//CDS//3329557025//1381//frame0
MMSLKQYDMDDIGSFDDSEPSGKLPESPNRTTYPVGLSVGGPVPGSPTRSIISSSADSFGKNESHSLNAVHMHVQENAKVPLLNHPIDRKNSSRPLYHRAHLDSNKTTRESDKFSMAEFFLKNESNRRQSANLNYEGIGALLDDMNIGRQRSDSGTFTKDGNTSMGSSVDAVNPVAPTPEDEAQMEIDALTAAIDPTPWSEIEQKIQKQQTAASRLPRQLPVVAAPHPHHNNYYPYGRSQQLPIPEHNTRQPDGMMNNQISMSNGNSSTGIPSLSPQAVATAAALASVSTEPTNYQTSPQPQAQTVMSKPPTTAPAPAPPPTDMGPPKSTNPPLRFQRQLATYPSHHHSAAHSTSRASVLAAADKKSQYGFGGDHTVPSVPAPPPVAPQARKPSPPKSRKSPVPPALPTLPPITTCNNTGAAYERKKQRAKDARVKLNDSIEHLSIAISLAGSQSKQRSHLLSNRIGNTEQRAKSLEINEECVRLAEQAKKWDRPSFVGTAASLVQAMNSQCECLVRELICFQERLDNMTGVPGNAPIPPASNGESDTPTLDHKRHAHPTGLESVFPNKRLRSDTQEGNGEEEAASSDEKVVWGFVARFMDPVSLSRCMCVSRAWKDMHVFDNDDIWLDLAVQRFGFFNVRQWSERLVDDDAEPSVVAKRAVYRAMNAANVMPPIQQQDGLVMLGSARIPGRLSAWVFLVERSNGETLRSVKREPGSTAPGTGPYHSRPVVELRVVLQNNGMGNHPVVIKNQQISVDVSTRRRGGELSEIHWDNRFLKVVKNLDGSRIEGGNDQSKYDIQGELCRLRLFEAAIIEVHINAKGCSTTAKFRQRSNFTKILVSLEGTTVPMVIPFLRDGNHGH